VKPDPYLTLLTKIKIDENLNIRPETMKFQKESIGKQFP